MSLSPHPNPLPQGGNPFCLPTLHVDYEHLHYCGFPTIRKQGYACWLNSSLTSICMPRGLVCFGGEKWTPSGSAMLSHHSRFVQSWNAPRQSKSSNGLTVFAPSLNGATRGWSRNAVFGPSQMVGWCHRFLFIQTHPIGPAGGFPLRVPVDG